jgi:vitamin B12 transporter
MVWSRLSATVGGRIEHNESFGTAAVPRGSIVYVVRASAGPVGDTRLKATAGLGIKEPTTIQSFSTSPFFLGNPDLTPERSRTADVGVEQRLAGDRGRVTFTWFENRYSNIISTTSPDPVTFGSHYDNIGDTRARGFELSADAVPIAAIQVHAGYTLLRSDVVTSTSPDSAVFAVGQWAFRRPRHSGFLDVSWTRDRVTADLNATFVGRFVDSDFAALTPPLVENPGYSVWNARISVQFARRTAIVVAADNLADRDYMEPLGYQTLRRAVRAGIRTTF